MKNLKTILSIIINKHLLRKPDFSEKNLFLQGQLMAEVNDKKEKINSLKDVEFSVFSQFGEDGIIHWIINDPITNVQHFGNKILNHVCWRYLQGCRSCLHCSCRTSIHHLSATSIITILSAHECDVSQEYNCC